MNTTTLPTGLACDTPAGLTRMKWQRVMQRFVTKKDGCKFLCFTSKASEADGLVTYNGAVRGVIELKCREYWSVKKGTLATYEKLKAEGYLITASKITNGVKLSKAYHVPFFIVVWIALEPVLADGVASTRLIKIQVTDNDGNIIVPHTVRNTTTQYCVNGGTVPRDNAYVDITQCPSLFMSNTWRDETEARLPTEVDEFVDCLPV